MVAGSVVLSVLTGAVTLLASLLAGHPVAVALMSYVLAGGCTMLALALNCHRTSLDP